MKSTEKVSELPEKVLAQMLKTDDSSYIAFFKKISASLEKDVGTLTMGMPRKPQHRLESIIA